MRRSVTLITISLASLSLTLTACSNNPPVDADPFATLQACYDAHHSGSEHLPIQQAIVTCCLDHPIGGMKAPTCPMIQMDCFTHVRAALDPSIVDADINAACTTYINASHN